MGLKVFISWSGARSRAVASALKEWLPIVMEGVDPWVSDKDISAGERWAQSVAGELESANFGIICITPENLNADWILFEAGALSKSMQDAKVIPLLFDLEFSDISGPLAQFQAKKLEKDSMREVVLSINKCAETPTSEEVLGKRFEPLWATFEGYLASVPAKEPAEKSKRNHTQVLEELVASVRSLEAKFRSSAPQNEEVFRFSRKQRLHPKFLLEFRENYRGIGAETIVLPALAGLLREDAPWFSEVLLDASRDLMDPLKGKRQLGLRKLRELLRLVESSSAMFRELFETKDAYFFMREACHLIEFSIEELRQEAKGGNSLIERLTQGNS